MERGEESEEEVDRGEESEEEGVVPEETAIPTFPFSAEIPS